MSDTVTTAADDLVEAEAMVRQIMADHPDLTDCGIGVFRERRLTDAERVIQFTQCRDRMLNPRSIRQFCAARAWLQQFPKIRTFNHPETSYGLKRVAEPTIGYVTNGMFICAALAAGYRIEREPGSSNVVFRYSTKGVAAVIKPSELTIIKGPTAAERSRLALRIACDAARGGRTALYLLSKTRTQIESILARALGSPDGWPLSLEIHQALPPMDRGGLGVVSSWLRAYPTAAMVVIDPATVIDLTKRRGIAAELKALAWETSATIITVQTM